MGGPAVDRGRVREGGLDGVTVTRADPLSVATTDVGSILAMVPVGAGTASGRVTKAIEVTPGVAEVELDAATVEPTVAAG